MSSPSGLVVRDLTTRWSGRPVLDGLSFQLAPGEYVTVMGPNGAGKSTLLRTIAGFERADGGSILLDGRELQRLPPHRRRVGLLFQEPTLLPRRTVWENVAYGPQLQRRPDAEVDRVVAEMLELLRLTALSERDAGALSGGERQRVALARSLAARPSLLLLDEPFAAVDPELRSALRAEFRAAIRAIGVPSLHVTHDREEGMFLGDRVLLLLDGRIAQSGPPREVHGAPGSEAVARFLGYNILRSEGQSWAVAPTAVRWETDGDGVPGEVIAAGPLGDRELVVVRLADGERWEVRGGGSGPSPAAGDRVRLRWAGRLPLPAAPQ